MGLNPTRSAKDACVAQLAEAVDPKSIKYRFESDHRYQVFKGVAIGYVRLNSAL